MTALEAYLQQINQYPLLTKKDEIRLSKIIHTSKKEIARKKAIDKMVLGNLRLVVKCANKLFSYVRYSDYLDVIQEGNRVLPEIAQQYNYQEFKTRFSSYAYKSLLSKMIRAINANRFIKIPSRHHSYMSKLLVIAGKQGRDDIDEITLEDISKDELLSPSAKKRITEGVLAKLKGQIKSVVIFPEDFDKLIEQTLIDEHVPDASLEEKKEYIKKILSEVCPPLVQALIYEYFYKENTVGVIAKNLGISVQTIYTHLGHYLPLLKARIVQDKKDFDEIPLKRVRVMEGKVKATYRKSRKYSHMGRQELVIE